MRSREKLTLEEKVALALDLIRHERSLGEIQAYYRVSHTTAYKMRNAFLDGGRAALGARQHERREYDLEGRVRALEARLQVVGVPRRARSPRTPPRFEGKGNGTAGK